MDISEMLVQVSRLCEPFTAHAALVWLLPGVSEPVHPQCRPICEPCATKFTLMWLHPCVDPFVRITGTSGGEAPPTMPALERLFSSVGSPVGVKFIVGAKLSATVLTLGRLSPEWRRMWRASWVWLL